MHVLAWGTRHCWGRFTRCRMPFAFRNILTQEIINESRSLQREMYSSSKYVAVVLAKPRCRDGHVLGELLSRWWRNLKGCVTLVGGASPEFFTCCCLQPAPFHTSIDGYSSVLFLKTLFNSIMPLSYGKYNS